MDSFKSVFCAFDDINKTTSTAKIAMDVANHGRKILKPLICRFAANFFGDKSTHAIAT